MYPIISVIIPCYNQAQYLAEALDSVFQQEYQEWECIIVNDGSLDNTEEVAETWSKKDNRFKYLKKQNTGVSDTRNYGIRYAKGEFILPLDADDKISNNYLSRAIREFGKNPDIKLIYCNVILFDKVNKEVPSVDFVFEKMLTENQISNAGIFRKSEFLKTSGYNINMADGLEDWDFWLSFIKPSDKVVKLEDCYLYYRIKDVSRSTLIDREKNEKLILQMFKNHATLYLEYFNPIRDHINAEYYKKLADSLRKSPEYKTGSFLFFPFKVLKKIKYRLLKK